MQHDNVVLTRKGKLALVNAPPKYHNMNRLLPRAKDSKDVVDTIHLFVADTEELERLLPTALSYRGQRTNLIVLFRCINGRTDVARDLIEKTMDGHGFRPVAGIGMSGDYGASAFRSKN